MSRPRGNRNDVYQRVHPHVENVERETEKERKAADGQSLARDSKKHRQSKRVFKNKEMRKCSRRLFQKATRKCVLKGQRNMSHENPF